MSLVVSAYNFGAVVAGPVFGLITDRLGHPKLVFFSSCGMKVLAYTMYSVNFSPYFPLIGRLISGLGDVGITVLLGQITLQMDQKIRAGIFVLVESSYCLGAVFGPGIGSFISFKVNVFGWKISEGNSPGIVMTIIWIFFFIFSLLVPKLIWVESATCHEVKEENSPLSVYKEGKPQTGKTRSKMPDSRIFCLLFIIFCSEAFSSTSTFYVAILALDHFHLNVIHIKLLFLNSSLFTLAIFLCFHLASKYFEERKLLVVAFIMQIIAISFLISLAFSWNQVHDGQHYILLAYVCFGMPYFAFPLANSILSKVTNPENATFIQGLSYATVHLAIVVSRVVVSFAFTEVSLIHYSLGLIALWLVAVTWFSVLYKRMAPKN